MGIVARRWGLTGACLGAGLACFASCTSLLGNDFEVTSAPTGSGAGVSSGGSAGSSAGGQGATSSGGGGAANGGAGGGGAPPAPGTPQWAEGFGDGFKQQLWSVKVDDAGNIWLVGDFAGTMDFGITSLAALGTQDAFLVELGPDGTPLMAKQFGGGGATATALDVMLTDAGEPVVIGSFGGTVNFGAGPFTTQGTVDADMFLLKLKPDGSFLWARQYGAAASTQTGVCVARAPGGHIVVGGNFASGIDLGGGNLTSAATIALFFGVLDESGNHLASAAFGTQGTQQLYSLVVDSYGAIYATGTFTAPILFGLNPQLVNFGGKDAFLVKLDSSVTPVWARGFGGVGDDGGAHLALSPAGDVLGFAGWVSSGLDFGAPAGPLPFGGGFDGVVATFQTDGTALWSKSTGGAGTEGISGVAIGPDGQVYVTGVFSGALDLGGGPVSSTPGVVDFFLAELKADDSHVFTKRFGGAANQFAFPPWPEVAATPGGGVVLAGWYLGSVDFGLGALQQAGNGDLFAAKYY